MLLAVTVVALGSSEADAQLLKDLRGVSVNIEEDNDALQGAGVLSNDLSDIKAAVSLRLRQNGITVNDSASPQVQVKVLMTGVRTNRMVHVEFRVVDDVMSVRTQRRGTVAIWILGAIGNSPDSSLAQFLKSTALSLTDRFLNDYLGENPRLR